MKLQRTCRAIPSVLVVTLVQLSTPAAAQVVPDTTLPLKSSLSTNGNVLTIEGGTSAGGNLFHSFEEFSVPTGSEAFFNNALTVQNIFTRVTGENISRIDGLMRANGTANLFLLNPNGIVFGLNARLEIGGSFLGSTAESILFEDGMVYSATNSPDAESSPPLLSIDVPIGLQMGTNPGEISVQGVGHNLTQKAQFLPVIWESPNPGLQVKSPNTLALIGGNIRFHGGIVSVGGGHIALESARSGRVGLNSLPGGWTFDDRGVSEFGQIELRSQSLVDASGVVPGSISVRGGRVSVAEGSFILLQNRGIQPGGNIEIAASDLLELSGAKADLSLESAIASDTVGEGNGGDITIAARRLSMPGVAKIETRVYGTGNGGNIILNIADSIETLGPGVAPISFGLYIGASTFNAGDAGNVSVSADRLSLLEGSLLTSTTFGSGDGGDVTVNATELVEVAGIRPNFNQSSAIGASTFNRGDAGNLTVNTSRLVVRDGGRIDSSTFASGAAGSIAINATDSLELSQTRPTANTAKIVSSADLLSAVTQGYFRLPPVPEGASGNVTISTPRLVVGNTTAITVSNQGTNHAGNLHIAADTLELEGNGVLSASTQSGKGGNLSLQVGSLQLHNSSQITAESAGEGNGGNVTVDAQTIALLDNSKIDANAIVGAGGNIQITTQGLFGSTDSRITASSQFGVDGLVSITNPEVDPGSSLVNLSQETIDPAEQVVAGCQWMGESEFVATGRGGVPANPNRPVSINRPWSDVRELWAFRGDTPLGSLVPVEKPERLQEATGWVVNEDGTVMLVAATDSAQTGNFLAAPCNPLSHNR